MNNGDDKEATGDDEAKEVTGGGDAGTGDGLTQVQENEGATTAPVITSTTALEPAEDEVASHNGDSTAEIHVTETDEPASSPSEHEGESPVMSNSSALGLGIPETLLTRPMMRSPSAPPSAPLRRRHVAPSPPSHALGAGLQRASSSPGSLSGSSGSTNDDPVDLTGGFHFVEPHHVVVVRPSAR